jgi:hypothetical protein
MARWVDVTIAVAGFVGGEKTRINMDHVVYVQQVADGDTLVHFSGGQTLNVKESMDQLLGEDFSKA